MTNLTLSIAFLLGAIFTSLGQIHDNAIGLRGGGGFYGSGAEITYQKALGTSNRIELDFGFYGSSNYSHLVATAIYQWVSNISEGLNWYVGPAAQFGTYNGNNFNNNNSGISLGLGGQIGLEYDLNQHDLPFLLSFDTRPIIRFIGGNFGSRFNYGGNFAVRYTF